jgi:eukaryotic-like serine/threonine-protein kinase
MRYEPVAKLASGGMGTVYVGLMRGAMGFRQLVALKQPHDHLAEEEEFRRAFVMEAKLASLVRHANVVDVRDIEVSGDVIQLVMDYVEGASLLQVLMKLASQPWRVRVSVGLRAFLDACAGLDAIHEVTDETGQWMKLVHYDVSPQNILVGLDGVSRVTDFGIAKSARLSEVATTTGMLKGKFGYMAPELLHGRDCDRRADVFAAGVVLWEILAGKRLFKGENEIDSALRTLNKPVPPVGTIEPELTNLFDAYVFTATDKVCERRYATMEQFARDVETVARAQNLLATHAEVGKFVEKAFGERIFELRSKVREHQERAGESIPTPATPSPAVDPAESSQSLTATELLKSSPATVTGEAKDRRWRVRGLVVGATVAIVVGAAFAVGVKMARRDPFIEPTVPAEEVRSTIASAPGSASPGQPASPLESAVPQASAASAPSTFTSQATPPRIDTRTVARPSAATRPTTHPAYPMHKPLPNPYASGP